MVDIELRLRFALSAWRFLDVGPVLLFVLPLITELLEPGVDALSWEGDFFC